MILAYHEIRRKDCPYLYSITSSAMEEHLHFLTKLYATSGDPFITFDDGHMSQYENGLPLLERFSLHGIFFITPQWTETRPAYMTWAQLNELLRLGHQVQSHSWSHKFLPQCSAAELEVELRGSREILEDRLGVSVDALAVPHGAWNERVLAACAAVGYRRVYVSEPWLHHIRKDGLEVLGRVCVQRSMNCAILSQFEQAERSPFSMIRVRYRSKRAVRAVLGERLYHNLWYWIARAGSRNDHNGNCAGKNPGGDERS